MSQPSLQEVRIEYPNFPECPSCRAHTGVRDIITITDKDPGDDFYIPPELLILETIIITCEPAYMEGPTSVDTSYKLGYHRKGEPDFGGETTGGVKQSFECPARIRILKEARDRRDRAKLRHIP